MDLEDGGIEVAVQSGMEGFKCGDSPCESVDDLLRSVPRRKTSLHTEGSLLSTSLKGASLRLRRVSRMWARISHFQLE